ncbi:abasic site processing protein HMCES [Boleophthalmus pectinirostris]|uniref:abasic site processing protein HMCES n=1 Tax=Boleophthalmus pectinirostris TaxID=150288 RepID=UPI000A1C1E0D|nr:abasic site processing protein HMCES [Boleophthalmus pectinirostris]XP_055018584.1 abasic site processing protein HMCES [Boleophthalmus pectinirostris]
MCGRTACTLAPDEISRACTYRNRGGHRRQPRWKDGDADKYRPSYNKSPQSNSPVLLSQRHFDKSAPFDECVLASMRWGLIPNWFRESDPNKMQYSTNNCRSESILEKKTYKDPLLKGQRCVILADGFYEWKRQAKEKQPFFIYFPQNPGVGVKQETEDESESSASNDSEQSKETMTDQVKDSETKAEWTGWRLLTMAGLFDCWTPPGGGEPLYTYTVVTVNASSNLEGIHDRMPAILDGEEEVRKWLDFGEIKSLDALKLLQSKNILTYHPVSSLVNNSRNNTAECLQPVCLETKKEPEPTASSKMMMSWLKSGATQKRKDVVETGKEQMKDKSNTEAKSAGLLDQWLHGTSKKPKIQ